MSAEGAGVTSCYMEPAPGYDPLLPHDLAHFVVENELGIRGGVFGQIAAGGTAGTFRPVDPVKNRIKRKARSISDSNDADCLRSERVVDITVRIWKGDHPEDAISDSSLTREQVARICSIFDEVSGVWSNLAVGCYMILEWKQPTQKRSHRLK